MARAGGDDTASRHRPLAGTKRWAGTTARGERLFEPGGHVAVRRVALSDSGARLLIAAFAVDLYHQQDRDPLDIDAVDQRRHWNARLTGVAQPPSTSWSTRTCRWCPSKSRRPAPTWSHFRSDPRSGAPTSRKDGGLLLAIVDDTPQPQDGDGCPTTPPAPSRSSAGPQ